MTEFSFFWQGPFKVVDLLSSVCNVYVNVLPFVRPKPLSYKGQDVGNVFYLRTPEEANSIAALASNKNAVIVGTSFIGESLKSIKCTVIYFLYSFIILVCRYTVLIHLSHMHL